MPSDSVDPVVSQRDLWVVAAVTLLALDPITTAIAVRLGLGTEANPLLAPLVSRGNWGALIAAKAAMLASVWAVWTGLPRGWSRRWVPRYAAASGSLVVVSNLAMIGLSAGWSA